MSLRPEKMLQIHTIDLRTLNKLYEFLKSLLSFISESDVYCINILGYRVSTIPDEYFSYYDMNNERSGICAIKMFESLIIKNKKMEECFDFLEFFYKYIDENDQPEYIKRINFVFEEEKVAFTILKYGLIMPIIDEVEVQSLEASFEQKSTSVKQHFEKALQHYSNRENPDYRNSMKSSIEALEHLIQEASGIDDFSKGMKHLEHGFRLNGALVQSITCLFGYASQTCRHANANKQNIPPKQEDALLMLVQSSAFINYSRV